MRLCAKSAILPVVIRPTTCRWRAFYCRDEIADLIPRQSFANWRVGYVASESNRPAVIEAVMCLSLLSPKRREGLRRHWRSWEDKDNATTISLAQRYCTDRKCALLQFVPGSLDRDRSDSLVKMI